MYPARLAVASTFATIERSKEREKLSTALVNARFTAFVQESRQVDLGAGLATVGRHAKELGYDGIVPFLDELILWLASGAWSRLAPNQASAWYAGCKAS